MGSGFTLSLIINETQYASKIDVEAWNKDMKLDPISMPFPNGIRLYAINHPVSVVVINGHMEDFADFVALDTDLESSGAKDTSKNSVSFTRDGAVYARDVLAGAMVMAWDKKASPKKLKVTINLLTENI